MQPNNTLFDLSYLTILNLEGVEAQTFLQGQLSCDVREVNPQQGRPAALCNLQGRIVALMHVIQWEGLHLILPHTLEKKVVRTLSKPAAFSRVNIQSTSDYSVFGFYLASENDFMPFDWRLPTIQYEMFSDDKGCCYSLGHQTYLLMIKSTEKEALLHPFLQKQQVKDSLAWRTQSLNQGQVEIHPESSELFLPHRLDLHLKGYLNFNKGCYRGQEIIARTHYRATLKHTLKQFTVHTTEPLHIGMKLLSLEGIEVGELVDFYLTNDHEYRISASVLFEHPKSIRFEGHQTEVILRM